VLDALKIDRTDLVTHDIGDMVGYAFAAQYPPGVARFVRIPASCSSQRSIRTPSTTKAFLATGKLGMPVLGIGGETSFGKTMTEIMRFAASDVRKGLIPDSMVRSFLDS
jgi:hypothetical protein